MAAPGANFKDLQTGDERAYEALAEVVRQAVSELAAAFEPNVNTGDEEKFRRFAQALITRTDQAIDGCCREAAKIVRCCTVLTEVRALPTSSCAAELRREAFGALDSFRQNIDTMMTKLQPLTPDMRRSYPVEVITVMEILKSFPSSRSEYLSILKEIPERLLDYACAQCFAGQISLERQNKAVESLEALIEKELQAQSAKASSERSEGSELIESVAKPGGPKKCSYCGRENNHDAKACSGCGTAFELQTLPTEAEPLARPATPSLELSRKASRAGKGLGCLAIVILWVLAAWIGDMAGCNPETHHSDSYQAGFTVGRVEGLTAYRSGSYHATKEDLDAAARRAVGGVQFDPAKGGLEDWIQGYQVGYDLGWDLAKSGK